jgi:DNA repair exonuclease SbcCD ATPase subunit
MQSGVRRISEHFQQREQEMRLHTGQLRVKRDELLTALQDAITEKIDTSRIVSEAVQSLNVPSSLTVEDLTQRSRRELDALSVESIQLDEAVSAIAAFRERRKADAGEAERLTEQIQSCAAKEAAAASANDEALRQLELSRLASEQRSKELSTALELQRHLQDRLSAQRRVEELTVAEEEASSTLRTSQQAAARLRTDMENLRLSSDRALDRRRACAVNRSELDAARDRARIVRDMQHEEAQLIARVNSLMDEIGKREREGNSLRLQLQEAREEMSRRRDEHERLSRMASSSDALESLLRQAVTMFPPNLSECPLCGTSFTSQQELLQHISRTREQFSLTSDALSGALRALRVYQELIEQLEREVQDASQMLAAMEHEKNQCDENLHRVREALGLFPAQIELPASNEQVELLDTELRSIDEELKTLKNDIDDRTARLGVAQDDVSRASARLETIEQQLVAARQGIDAALPSSGLEELVASAADTVRSTSASALDAADTEKAATEDELAKQAALQSIRRHLSDLRNQLLSVRERGTAETATLLGQLAGQVQGVLSVDEAADRVQKRRAEVTDRLVVMKRLWSELFTAGVEERSRAIRVQSDAVERELAATQRSLDQLLHAHTRFGQIAHELQKTAESEAADALRLQQQAIQECFAAMYPHWHLNEVVVGDEPLGEILVTDSRLAHGVEPTTYLSTGQANVLGLSIFIGIALRQRVLRTGVVCLDEPVQHLDDLHFLGFVSLLKRIGLSRQVVLSTADANVAEIITRQMQSSWVEQPTDFIRYDWHSFDPETGPRVVMLSSAKQAVA